MNIYKRQNKTKRKTGSTVELAHQHQGRKIRIFLQNCRGLNRQKKRTAIIRAARQKNPDIVILTETKATPSTDRDISRAWGQHMLETNTISSLHPGRAKLGTTILFKRGLEHTIVKQTIHQGGQYVIVTADIRSRRTLIIAIYGNADNSDRYAAQLINEIQTKARLHTTEAPHVYTILAGDFNCTFEPADSTKRTHYTEKPRTRDALLDIIQEYGLTDMWRMSRGDEPGYTYRSRANLSYQSRIDYIFANDAIIGNPDMQIINNRLSDHSAIILDTQGLPKAKPQWKHPDYLLKYPRYLQTLHQTIRDVIVEHSEEFHQQTSHDPDFAAHIPLQELEHRLTLSQETSTASYVETIMAKITQNAKSYLKRETRRTQQKEQQLTRQLNQMERQHGNDAKNLPQHAAAMEELSALRHTMAIRSAERMGIQYSIEGERPTAYFLKAPKRVKADRAIHELQTKNGEQIEIKRGQDATDYMIRKFRTLYEEPTPINEEATIDEFLHPIPDLPNAPDIPKVTHTEAQRLTEELREAEIELVIAEAKTNSSPGPSGISYQLIAAIWPFIKTTIMKYIKEVITGETLPAYLRKRCIPLIRKPGKPKDDPDGYRGISLLEILYKLISGAYARRLAPIANRISGPWQKGFLPGRSMAQNIRAVLDAKNLSHLTQHPLIITFLDFTKAFDMLSQKYVTKVLAWFEFPTQFIKTIKLLLNKPLVTIKVNSQESQEFTMNDGSGQGDPLSSFMFGLSAEILNIRLAYDQSLKRYKIPQIIPPQQEQPRHEHQIQQQYDEQTTPEAYADDILLLLDGNHPQTIADLMTITEQFQTLSGLQLNRGKTDIMPIMCQEEQIQRVVEQLNIRKVTTKKHLGAHITQTEEEQQNANFDPLTDRIDTTAEIWSRRNTTPLGTSLVIKSLITSQAVHVFQSHAAPHEWMEQTQKQLKKALWGSGRPQISKDRITQPISRGGINLVDIQHMETSLKVLWARKLLDPKTRAENWYRILAALIAPTGVRPQQIPLLGHRDIFRIAHHMNQIGNAFWAKTLRQIANIVLNTKINATDWQTAPLFGSHLTNPQTDKTHTGISIANPEALKLLHGGIHNIGHLFRKEEANDLINPKELRSHIELEAEIADTISPWLYTAIRNAAHNYVHSIPTGLRNNRIRNTQHTPITAQIHRSPKGCNFAYKQLIDADARKLKEGPTAKAFWTWKRDFKHNMTENEWAKGLQKIQKAKLNPRIRWLNMQIFIRTNWTACKEVTSLQDPTIEDVICRNCGQGTEHTHHLYYDCQVAQYAWRHLTNLIKQAWNTTIQTQQEHILFLKQQEHVTKDQDLRITHIIMAYKYTISRLRFTANVPNPPTLVVDAMLNTQIKVIKEIMKAEDRHDEEWDNINCQ